MHPGWRITMEDANWIYGIWFVGDGVAADWLCQLFRRPGMWILEYRFRYYSAESQDPFDDKDRKSWHAFRSPDDSIASRDKMVSSTNKLLPLIEARIGSAAEFVLLDCAPDDPKLMFELGSRPWCHMKVEEPRQGETPP
jgi:hypothetical protein